MTPESSTGGVVVYINIAFIRADQAFNFFFPLSQTPATVVPEAARVDLKCVVCLASGQMIMRLLGATLPPIHFS